jgi:hypothetical protein
VSKPEARGRWGRAAAAAVWTLAAGAAGIAAEPTRHVEPAAELPEVIELPEPPVWRTAPQAPLYSLTQIMSELHAGSTAHPQLIHQAESFVRPDLAWLRAYIKWFAKLEKPLHLKYQEQAFDCDKYARCFVAFADLLALKQGELRASVCVGWVTVDNAVAFGGVEPGNGHALVLVGTDQGLMIVEPQGGAMTPLAQYPNRDRLQQVNF